jgi:hypothetical protein
LLVELVCVETFTFVGMNVQCTTEKWSLQIVFERDEGLVDVVWVEMYATSCLSGRAFGARALTVMGMNGGYPR